MGHNYKDLVVTKTTECAISRVERSHAPRLRQGKRMVAWTDQRDEDETYSQKEDGEILIVRLERRDLVIRAFLLSPWAI